MKITLIDLVNALAALGVEACVEEDLQGQIVIYTGLQANHEDPNDDQLIPFEG